MSEINVADAGSDRLPAGEIANPRRDWLFWCYRADPMNARDLMSADVARVAPDTPLRDVAKALLAHNISAIPVVDQNGAVVGMVSEGDLIHRRKTDREARSESWLGRLAEGEPVSPEFIEPITN